MTMLALCAWALVGCSEDSGEPAGPGTGGTTPELKITSEMVVNVEAEGGEITIEFEIEGAEVGQNVDVRLGNELWLSRNDFSFSFDSDAGYAKLDVDPNEGAARTAKVVVVYEDQNKEITVNQKAGAGDDPATPSDPDVEFTANYFYGQYWGTYYSDAYNYYIILSDQGIDNTGMPIPGAIYYVVDVYSDVAEGTNPGYLPVGVYEYDPESSLTAGTFSGFDSYWFTVDENFEIVEDYFEEGTLTVTETGLELLVTMSSGEVHKVVYEGSNAYDPIPEPEDNYAMSTLDGDYAFELPNAYVIAETYGDEFGVGCNYWYIYVYEDIENPFNGRCLQFEMLLPFGEEVPVGEFTAYSEEADALEYTFLPADYMVEDGYMYPLYSWLFSITEGSIDGELVVPIADGDMAVSSDGENLVIELDCVDDKGNAVAGIITAGLTEIYYEVYEDEVYSAGKRSLGKQIPMERPAMPRKKSFARR